MICTRVSSKIPYEHLSSFSLILLFGSRLLLNLGSTGYFGVAKMSNTVNHVEIPVLNLKKAKQFYESIFDWKVDTELMPNYGIVELENTASIGFFVVEKVPDHGVNVVFEVEDINQKLGEIKQAGGSVLREKYEIAPEIGFSAQFQDCFGNEFGLFSRK